MSNTYVELSRGFELLLFQRHGAQSPPARVQIALHNTALDFGNNTVVTSGKLHGRHLSDTNCDSFTLGGHEHDFFTKLDTSL